tara:strand:+ start:298 stop:1002 length:705 start_codon:yes stop_codon:yes gene_type:complete
MSVKISIIIPVYNEDKTITELLNKVERINNLNKQILIVDDASSDLTLKKISDFKFKSEYRILAHKKNTGKGGAIHTAKKYVDGEIVIIQDGDLEYDPADYEKLIDPIIKKKTRVVYGSRVLGKTRYEIKSFTSIFRIFCNHMLTLISNLINNQNLTDSHTCYKVFDATWFRSIKLTENRFGFCPEITTKVSNHKLKIIEVPINYKGRKYSEGKKISYLDGIRAIYCLIKYKFVQ